MRENLKTSIVIKNVIGSEDTLMHKAERPCNFFPTLSHIIRPTEQITKGVICVQISLEIHLTEHSRFHIQGWTTSFTQLRGNNNVVFLLKVLYRYNCIS